MELPKNIMQIGEINKSCKVYVEDYALAYIRQLNEPAGEKEMAVGLYGVMREEQGITYVFVYGVGRLMYLQREAKHLSQAMYQEIKKIRDKNFPEHSFVGYGLLDGDTPEGFYIEQNGVCRYVAGYARFYEKNDSMLKVMLESKPEAAKPEEVNLEKYEEVRKRQELRRQSNQKKEFRRSAEQESEQVAGTEEYSIRKSGKLIIACMAFLACAGGLLLWYERGSLDKLQSLARETFNSVTQRKLPEDMQEADEVQVGTIVAEDRLNKALLEENQKTAQSNQSAVAVGQPESQTVVTEETATGDQAVNGQVVNGQAVNGQEITGQEANGQAVPDQALSGQEAVGGERANQIAPGEGTAADNQNQTSQAVASNEKDLTKEDDIQEQGEEPDAAEKDAKEQPVVKTQSAYVVKKGDTLIGICLRQYGTDSMVSELCRVNHIDNPDNIREGEKILLP